LAHTGIEVAVPSAASGMLRRLDRWFYFLMALLIGASVAYGFSRTIVGNLFRPAISRPIILWIHAAAFVSWVVLFITQAALIRSRRVRWHRRLGAAGLALGICIPVLGIATSLTMARFNTSHGLDDAIGAAAFLAVPFNDMAAFAGAFAAAAWLRKKPEYHRRLMLVATIVLTAAAFARFPFITVEQLRFYGGVDFLLLLCVVRDWFATGRIHTAYALSLPPIVVGQVMAMTLFLARPAPWIDIAGRLVAGR
jgi:hypothetical protein